MQASGLCMCGCGSVTAIITQTRLNRGLIKGEFRKYLKAHHLRKSIAPVCGYVVDEKTGCWDWLLSKSKAGYGRTKKDGQYRGAHIIEWERINGPVPIGLELDHLCRNVACVNPSHLEAVTPTENKRRSNATKLTKDDVRKIKGSQKTHKELGADFGVSASNISQIKRGFSWKEIEP